MHESAGKQSPAGKRHGNKWLTAMLVEAAGSVGRMHGKNYLAAQHARLMKRRGMGRAQVAVAHSMLVASYWMLKRDEPYHDLGVDLAQPPKRPSPHPTPGSTARTPRPHGDHRPSRLNTGLSLQRRVHMPDAAAACPVVEYSRVCVAHRILKSARGT